MYSTALVWSHQAYYRDHLVDVNGFISLEQIAYASNTTILIPSRVLLAR